MYQLLQYCKVYKRENMMVYVKSCEFLTEIYGYIIFPLVYVVRRSLKDIRRGLTYTFVCSLLVTVHV